jgi:phosphate transport system protein
MPVHFQQDLDALKEKLLIMARHAESAVSRAMRAFSERDAALAQLVKADDSILDAFEKDIDELAINLLTHAPLAADLRRITVAMKICHNLERVGDEATTIARRVGELNAFPRLTTGTDPAGMARLGLAMLQEALEAFVNGDTARARAVIPRDKQLDAANRQLHLELKATMTSDASSIPPCLHWMTISKSLERIGDHAKNIAEEVVYLHEGRDIRHAAEVRPKRAE